MRKLLLCGLLMAVAAGQSLADEAIWIEGENAAQTSAVKHGWFSNVEKELVSGGDWLSNYSTMVGGEATWNFTAKEGGKYTFYARVNMTKTKYQYNFDGAEMQDLSLAKDAQVGGTVNISPGGNIDHRFLCWVKGGEVDLTAGDHTLKMTLDGEINHSGGVDCIALVNYAWTPAGLQKPGDEGKAPTIAVPANLQPSKVETEAVEGKGEYLWIEGEHASQQTFREHSWYANVNKDLLSGGAFISHWSGAMPGKAHYKFSVQQGGKYTWWLRCNTVGAVVMLYAVDGGEPVPMDLNNPLGNINLVAGLDLRFMAWVKVAELDLPAGEHVLSVQTASENNLHGSIDCMALLNFDWTPAGTNRPALPE